MPPFYLLEALTSVSDKTCFLQWNSQWWPEESHKPLQEVAEVARACSGDGTQPAMPGGPGRQKPHLPVEGGRVVATAPAVTCSGSLLTLCSAGQAVVPPHSESWLPSPCHQLK